MFSQSITLIRLHNAVIVISPPRQRFPGVIWIHQRRGHHVTVVIARQRSILQMFPNNMLVSPRCCPALSGPFPIFSGLCFLKTIGQSLDDSVLTSKPLDDGSGSNQWCVLGAHVSTLACRCVDHRTVAVVLTLSLLKATLYTPCLHHKIKVKILSMLISICFICGLFTSACVLAS